MTLPVNILTPLHLKALPTFGSNASSTSSFNFLSSVTYFLFTPISDPLGSALTNTPSLSKFLSTLGVVYEQDIARLGVTPINIPSSSLITPPSGIFIATVNGKTIATSLSSNKTHQLFQSLKTYEGVTLTISLIPQNSQTITAKFDGLKVKFTPSTAGSKSETASVIAPTIPGTDYLTTSASPLTLAFNVFALPAKATSTPKFSRGGITPVF